MLRNFEYVTSATGRGQGGAQQHRVQAPGEGKGLKMDPSFKRLQPRKRPSTHTKAEDRSVP